MKPHVVLVVALALLTFWAGLAAIVYYSRDHHREPRVITIICHESEPALPHIGTAISCTRMETP